MGVETSESQTSQEPKFNDSPPSTGSSPRAETLLILGFALKPSLSSVGSEPVRTMDCLGTHRLVVNQFSNA